MKDNRYKVIPVMYNKDGVGPVSIQEADELCFEVWDMYTHDTMARFYILSLALEFSEKLNDPKVAK